MEHGVVGGLGGPQTKPIVMLRSEDHAAHAGVRQRIDDLIGIELSGLKMSSDSSP